MSVINRFNGSNNRFSWENVEPKTYFDKAGVSKHVLIGENEGSKDFIVRYFELEPGKSSNLEAHEHVHGVVILTGQGRVQINETFTDVKPFDAVFISPNDTHQLTNTGDGVFGFICVIKAW